MPVAADVQPIQDALARVRLGAPLVHRPLVVVPILNDSSVNVELDWMTMDDAGEEILVAEVTGEGAVSTVRVKNSDDRPLLVVNAEGIEVAGCLGRGG